MHINLQKSRNMWKTGGVTSDWESIWAEAWSDRIFSVFAGMLNRFVLEKVLSAFCRDISKSILKISSYILSKKNCR